MSPDSFHDRDASFLLKATWRLDCSFKAGLDSCTYRSFRGQLQSPGRVHCVQDCKGVWQDSELGSRVACVSEELLVFDQY